jgi:hypothetical protein
VEGPAHDDPAQDARSAPGLVESNFKATAPDQLWVADVTLTSRPEAGFLYLPVVLDRWELARVELRDGEHLRTELVLEALNPRKDSGEQAHSHTVLTYSSVALGRSGQHFADGRVLPIARAARAAVCCASSDATHLNGIERITPIGDACPQLPGTSLTRTR